MYFWGYGLQNIVLRSMSKKSRFSLPFEKQHGKRIPALLKSERQHLYHIYWSMWRPLSCKKSLLVICKIFRIFLNTFNADDNYSLLNRDNLTQIIQIQLSQKQKKISEFLSALLKSSVNFEFFQEKYDPHSWCICELKDSKKRG